MTTPTLATILPPTKRCKNERGASALAAAASSESLFGGDTLSGIGSAGAVLSTTYPICAKAGVAAPSTGADIASNRAGAKFGTGSGIASAGSPGCATAAVTEPNFSPSFRLPVVGASVGISVGNSVRIAADATAAANTCEAGADCTCTGLRCNRSSCVYTSVNVAETVSNFDSSSFRRRSVSASTNA